jgi:hypothetical protein
MSHCIPARKSTTDSGSKRVSVSLAKQTAHATARIVFIPIPAVWQKNTRRFEAKKVNSADAARRIVVAD